MSESILQSIIPLCVMLVIMAIWGVMFLRIRCNTHKTLIHAEHLDWSKEQVESFHKQWHFEGGI